MTYSPQLNLMVRVGCRIAYETSVPAPIVLVLKPRLDGVHCVLQERISLGPSPTRYEFTDYQGNITSRTMLLPGRNEIFHDALVAVSSLPDYRSTGDIPLTVDLLPPENLRYLLPSRYCDSDKLLNFAWAQFGHVPNGLQRVQAICDWIHNNVEYRYGAGSQDFCASTVVNQRFGVCRDFAHVGVALCRALNLPARYVTGHLPDIGFTDPGTPMDFHAYFEVYVGHLWYTFDPRFNVPRIGRVKICHGLDAVEGAFATIYGQAQLTYFEVWSYQVDPTQASLSAPVDLSRRLDGTPLLRFS